MKEKFGLIVFIIICIVVLLLAKNLSSSKVETEINNEVEENTVSEEENITTTVISSYDPNNAGAYYLDIVDLEEVNGEVLEITEADFENEVLKSDKKVLVEFYADWCGPCKTLSPILEEIAKENLDLKVVKVDVDISENIATKYRATSIPLLVVIENGKEIDRAVGALPKKEILELVK